MKKILIGGSPCTYWSINQNPNKREVDCNGMGWELFKNYLFAMKFFKPDYFLYENNESVSVNIQNQIEKELGVSLLHINSNKLSPQVRKRIYATNIDVNSEMPDFKLTVKDIVDLSFHHTNLIDEVKFNKSIENGLFNYEKSVRIGTIGNGGQGERVYSINGKSVTLTANGGGRGAKTGLYLINNEVRILSPLECERLQMLPDNYTLLDTISNNQRYKCIGNGWTASVIEFILKHMNIDKNEKLLVVSLYDGIATGRYVLDKLGFKNVKYYAYEIDKNAISIALKNHPDIIECGDAFQLRNSLDEKILLDEKFYSIIT